jgi:hypothetical protein
LLQGADATSLNPLGLAPQTIEAKLETLPITIDQWHTDLNIEPPTPKGLPTPGGWSSRAEAR